MPEKDGAEEKSTKSVVNKKQKQMMGEEGYDIARDMGRVRPSKDKKDATTMPPSKEMRKTQKVNKGPSALDIVKKKYEGQIMNVGKKKVKEELDLTQVAEAFGGYIIETQSGNKNKKNQNQNQETPKLNVGRTTYSKNQNQNQEAPPIRSGTTDSTAEFEKSFRRTKAFKQLNPDQKAGKFITRTPSLRSGFDTVELENPEDKTKQSKLDQEAKKRAETGKRQSDKVFTSNKTDTTVNPKDMVTDKDGNIIANPPPQTPENIERLKQSKKYQDDKKRGEKPLIDQDKFSSDTRTVDQDRVTRGSGDGRKAGRRGKTVTYSTFTKKPEVTGGQDRATDTRSSVYIPKPEEIEKIKPKPETKPETKRERNKRVRTAADQIISDIRTGKDKTVKTPTQSDDVPPPTPPKPTAVGAGDDIPKKTDAFSSIKKFARKNPQIAAAGTLAGYDLGKGILSKIMNLRGPSIRGGRAGFRSAGGNVAT